MGAVASTAGSLVGANAGKNAQKAANSAAQGAAANQNQMVGTETGALNQMLAQYFGPQTGTSTNNNAGTQVNSGNLQNALMNQYGANPLNAGQQSTMGTAGQLQNFNGLQPGQLSALQNTLGQNTQSEVNSLRASGGGVANQNNMYSNLLQQGNQAATNAGVQLGGQAAANQLAGLQSAGSLQSGVGAQQNQSQGQALSGLEGLFGQGLSGLQTGIGALGNLTNMYGQQGSAAAQQSAALGSPYGNALTQIGSATNPFGGGGGSSSTGLLGGGAQAAPGISLPAEGAGAAANTALLSTMGNNRSTQSSNMMAQQPQAAPTQSGKNGSPMGQAGSTAQGLMGMLGGAAAPPTAGGKNGSAPAQQSAPQAPPPGPAGIGMGGTMLGQAAKNVTSGFGGAPSAQGFQGATMGGVQNPNQGGFNGLTGSEMTNPGMGYQSRSGNAGGLGSLGPAQR
jgi:hypothetical protein